MKHFCRDCIHIKSTVKIRRVCKLNCVERSATDTCMWSGKRNPSKFEHIKRDGLTVRELIQQLNLLPLDLPVFVRCQTFDDVDYWAMTGSDITVGAVEDYSTNKETTSVLIGDERI